MPILAAFLGTLISGVLSALGVFLTKRAAAAIVTLGLAATAAATCWGVVSAIIAGLSFAAPSIVTTAATWIVPAHFSTCVSAVISTEVAVAAYRWTKNVALQSASAAL